MGNTPTVRLIHREPGPAPLALPRPALAAEVARQRPGVGL